MPIELGQTRPNAPFSGEKTESRVYVILSAMDLTWSADGIKHKEHWRPRTTVFIRERYQIDDMACTGYDAVNVQLDGGKASELRHDDVRTSDVDFMEHVIGRDEQVVGIVGAMLAEARAGNPAGDLFSQSISMALLEHVYDRYDRSRAVLRVKGRLSQRQIDRVGRYVREHIDSDLSVIGLAQLLQLSPTYFCKAFSKTLGVTPYRFVINERISIAKRRLVEPSGPALAEIARGLGFADQAHFSNVFHKFVGCSPSEFRRQSK